VEKTRWEYCQIERRDDGKPCATFYRSNGITSNQTESLERSERNEFEAWKKQTPKWRQHENNYLADRLICELLSEGWEWWQTAQPVSSAGWSIPVLVFRRLA